MPGQHRLGDQAKSDSPHAHGCPSCPHPVVGPSKTASPDVITNSKKSVRMGDMGEHKVCCGPGIWKSSAGSGTVFINSKKAFRLDDMVDHCFSFAGMAIQGSSDVIVGG